MKKFFLRVTAIVIVSQLQAQNPTDTAVKSLDEVVITANKFPNKTSLTGKVVTVINRQQLERSGGKDLSQILTEQAGLYIAGANSNAGKDKSVFLRGARTDHTLITIDGVPVYDPTGIGSNFDIRNLSANQIDRIEILKGSQSTLYGSDAIAGVINIITKKNITEKFSADGLLSYGSNNSFRGNAGLSGKSGLIDYNLSYNFYDTKGVNETISNVAHADKDGYRQNSLQAGMGIQASNKIRMQPYFRYNKIAGDIDQGAFTDELDYTFTQKSWQAGIRNEFSLANIKLHVLYNYNHIDRLYIDDSVKSRNGFDIYSRGSYKGAEHFLDAYFNTPVNKKAKLTAGMDYRNSNTGQEFLSVSSFGNYNSAYSSDSLHQDQLGLYAALNINNTKGLNLELGNRLNFHSTYGSNYIFNVNPSFLLQNKLKLFANLSSGYRTPSLYQLFSEFGNRNLQPESAYTAEGGIQYYSADNKWNGRLTLFGRNVKDVIFFYFNPITFQSQYINQDEQKDHGAEAELTYQPAKNILLKAFYSFVDGHITTKQNGKDTTYFNLLRRPKHSVGFNTGVNITGRLFISSNLLWFDKRKDTYFELQSFQTVNVTLDSYVLLDIYAEYSLFKNKSDNYRIKIFLDLRNITNSHYSEIAGYNTLGFNGYGGIRFGF